MTERDVSARQKEPSISCQPLFFRLTRPVKGLRPLRGAPRAPLTGLVRRKISLREIDGGVCVGSEWVIGMALPKFLKTINKHRPDSIQASYG